MDILTELKEILYLLIILISIICVYLGFIIGYYYSRRKLLKKLKKTGIIDDKTMTLLED